MMPFVRLVVCYPSAISGILITHRTFLEIPNELQNKIEIELSTNEIEPGENVNITVKSEPNSYVGLLGIDQSVRLLKTGNDISKSDIIASIDNYKSPMAFELNNFDVSF